ncbi:hypothetical protein Y013_25675 (plasmid) [Rhodococcus pyridinivorans SB3094]|uniref:Uncharacterized protein n=1 Tax=Rhodococcus pyridinivorans SB3094 TaxID=1435356 RepID=V9XLJ9_9NOCA|nr:hypothetical protein [Rhodococcus pyridinivorans]AHD24291.1 hypothetical protein Y013_25675 [Rhodococcus pyridinivorans SB3094]
MSIITVTAGLALAALVIWTIGAPIARLGGALLTIASLLCIVSGDPIATRAPLLLGGAARWLAGHFLTACKARAWSSRLAENIVTRTPLRYLDPVRGYEHRHARRPVTGSTPESTPDRIQPPVDDFAQWERELTADTAPTVPAPPVRPVAKRVPVRPAGPSRGVVYGKRAAKIAGNLAVRKVPGARAVRSAWRFVR